MELKVTYLPVNALKEYKNNARRHNKMDVDAIVASIKEFGFLDPIGVWGKDNIVVEGHGRLLAARELDMNTVPCIRLDRLSDEQRRAYALAHNRTAELSAWDYTMRDAELSNIYDIDMTAFGFYGTDYDIDEFFGEGGEDTKNAMETESRHKKVQCPHCGKWIDI